MPENRRAKTPDETFLLISLMELGDELAWSERRYVDAIAARWGITDTEARGIANLLARHAG